MYIRRIIELEIWDHALNEQYCNFLSIKVIKVKKNCLTVVLKNYLKKLMSIKTLNFNGLKTKKPPSLFRKVGFIMQFIRIIFGF